MVSAQAETAERQAPYTADNQVPNFLCRERSPRRACRVRVFLGDWACANQGWVRGLFERLIPLDHFGAQRPRGGVQRRCVSATSWEQGEAKLCAAMSLPVASHAPEEERSDDAFQSDSDLSERSDPRRSAMTMRFRATVTFSERSDPRRSATTMRFSDLMGAGRGKAVRSNVFAGGKPRPRGGTQ